MEELILGELTERKIGYGIVQPGESTIGGIPVIKVNNIISGLKSIQDLDTTHPENDQKYRKTRLNGGEIIISVVGTIGKTAIVPMNFKGCNLVRATALIDIKDPILSRWVKYYIDSPKGQSYINGNLNTTVQPTLNIKSLVEMPIPFYGREYAEKVVTILSKIDDKIENNRKINDNLEQQAQALYKSWFVDFEPFKDGDFVESELGLIPEGWKVVELGEVTKQITEKVKNRTDVKVLSPVTTGELVLSEEYFTKQVFSESIAKYITVKPLQFAYNPARVNIGSLGMNTFEFDGCVSPVYVVFECERDYQYFFDYFRKTEAFKEEVLARAIGGVRQSLSYKDFSLIKLIYPPRTIVEKFNRLYSNILVSINHNKVEVNNLTDMRDTLLPKLMSGELKINEIGC